MASIEDLRDRWNTLYRTTLPQLAKSKDNVQPSWPVHFDHCFARIILDNAIGVTRPWTEVVKSPAWKNLTRDQLVSAIELGESIAVGERSLIELDEKSLELRGKKSKQGVKRGRQAEEVDHESKRRHTEDMSKMHPGAVSKTRPVISSYFKPTANECGGQLSPSRKIAPPARNKDNVGSAEDSSRSSRTFTNLITQATHPDADPLTLISTSKLTPFRKEVLTLLCHVPRGRYTTYAAMSDHISTTSHKTCARAVGNAMRNNPFAPVVPCHRVLAHDGQIGGFGGHWGEEGKYAGRKRDMLREEGVRFDGRGRAVGEPFRKFVA